MLEEFLLLLEGNVFFGNYLVFIFVIIIEKKIKAERFKKIFLWLKDPPQVTDQNLNPGPTHKK